MRMLKFLSFFLWSSMSYAGQSDSLLVIYNNEQANDTLRINAAIDAAKLFMEESNDSSFYFVNKAWLRLRNYPESTYKTKSEANLFYVLGSVYINRNDSKTGLRYLIFSHALFAKIKHLVGSAYLLNNIGLVYSDKADYSKAINYYLKSLKIKEVIGKPLSIAYAHLN